jgi:hypothetical protein
LQLQIIRILNRRGDTFPAAWFGMAEQNPWRNALALRALRYPALTSTDSLKLA